MKIGIVLSGGGTRGMAHLGALNALDELGVKPAIISGTSSGALLGALYAAGNPPKEILKMVKAHASSGVLGMILSSGGLFSATGLMEILKSAIMTDDFEKLLIPLYVTATDIGGGRSVTFSEGPLFDALIGSSSVPGVFKPVKLGNQYLVDGGVMNNFPVECIKDKCDKLIGSHVNKLCYKNAGKLNRLQILDRCFHLAISVQVAINAKYCDVFLEPPLSGYGMFDMKYADRIFKKGYQAVMEKEQIISAWSN